MRDEDIQNHCVEFEEQYHQALKTMAIFREAFEQYQIALRAMTPIRQYISSTTTSWDWFSYVAR